MMRQLLVGIVAVIALSTFVLLKSDSAGEVSALRPSSDSLSEDGGSPGSPGSPAELPTVVRDEGKSADQLATHPQHAVLNLDEHPEIVNEAAGIFIEVWGAFQAEHEADMIRGEYGDSMVLRCAGSWGVFDVALVPTHDMFEGVGQSDKYMMASILQTAGQALAHERLEGGFSPTVETQLDRRAELRNRSLFYSPEIILDQHIPSGEWAKDPAFVSEVRATWTEMLKLVAPVENEVRLYERCIGKAILAAGGRLYDIEGDFTIIAPGVRSARLMREGLCQEFHDRLVDLAQDYQN